MLTLHSVFGFYEETIRDFMDIDESVRFTAFSGYDFASLVNVEVENDTIMFEEVNVYISSKYMILVMPEDNSKKLGFLEDKILESARIFLNNKNQSAADPSEYFNQLFFSFFNILILHFSDTLESLEDRT